jgi:hypothetical protein
LAGLEGLMGVVAGDAPGEGDRCGRRVCEAMMEKQVTVEDG